MHHLQRALLAAAIGSALPVLPARAQSVAAAPVAATSAEVEQLHALIRRQAEQIEALQQRLSALEANAAAAPAPVAAAAPAPAASEGTSISWSKTGPELRSNDGYIGFHPRGRLQVDYDATWGSAHDARNLAGVGVAGARLGGEGWIGPTTYRVEVDFANNAVKMKEVYLSWTRRFGGVDGELSLGNKLKDRGIDGGTSDLYGPFMRPNAVAAVGGMQAGSYGLGVTGKLYGADWHASLEISGDDVGSTAGTADDSLGMLTRAHWNPLISADGKSFAHLGGWAWREDLGGDEHRVDKTVPLGLKWNRNLVLGAGAVENVRDNHAYGLEAGGVYRNLWGFAEYTRRDIATHAAGTAVQRAASVYGGWLLTGDSPGFNRRTGLWSTTRVDRPLGKGGFGALELVARYDRYDFRDSPAASQGDAWTLGLNWHLNAAARLVFDYVHWSSETPAGTYAGSDSGDTVGVRAQLAF